MSFDNPLVYGVPCFLAFILLELVYSRHDEDHHDLYDWKELKASLLMGIGSSILAPLIKIVTVALLFNYVYDVFNPLVDGVHVNIMGWNSFGYVWYVWLLCQLADDFSYYWFHRQNHNIRFLWAAHIVHHSSDNFNLGTAVRNGWFTIIYKPLFYIWMPAIGFPVPMIIFCLGIEALWQFQLHTVYVPKMGFIEKIFNTHTMHQVHHARNMEYMDKNHGGFLNIFDKVFGTWKELDENIEIEYGVTHEPNSYNPLVILTHEYKDIWNDMKKSPNWYHKFMYAFAAPGWSHDGSTLTIKQLRKQMASSENMNSQKAVFDK